MQKSTKKLPPKIKLSAEKREKIFRTDPFNPQLKTHKLTGKLKEYYSFSIDYEYRIIFELAKKDTVWSHLIGTHEIYK